MQRRDILAIALGTVAGLGSARSAAGQPAGESRARRSAAHDARTDPAALAAGDGELVYVGRDPVRIKLSPAGKGRFAMITQDVSPGTVIPIHAHDAEDELIFIQAGEGEATVGGTRVQLASGSTLFVPQGTWHGGRNTGSETLKWVAIYSPSGFEGYFREIGKSAPGDPPRSRTPQERADLDARYAIRYRS